MFLLLACTPPDVGNTDAVVDTSGETGETAWDTEIALNGSWPPEPVGPAQFTAINRDGSERGPDDLTGHVTVMWFYPAADTPG